MRDYTKIGLPALFIALNLAACSGFDIPLVNQTDERALTIATVPGRDEVVRGDTDPPVVTLDLKSGLRERRLSTSDELPSNVTLPKTNLSGVPITAALQAVLAGTDISLSWNTGSLGSRLVTVMNLKGPLPQVVDKICSAARVFCTYRNGSIELSEKETFVITLPPVIRQISSSSISSSSSSSSSAAVASNTANNTIVESINKLLDGEKATVDDQGETIIYTASVDTEERISRYLTELRTQRPLIVLQMYIWEVTLNRENSEGINWTQLNNDTLLQNKQLKLSGISALSATSAAAGSVSLGAVTTGIISANAVASFIATKGRVQTISNPQITFVSGSSASLKVGGTQRYISQVGTNIASNVSGNAGTSNNSSSTSTNTVSTDSIDTGLSISLAGSYENGVVFADLDLTIRNLVGLNPVNSGGGVIDLPQTTDEKMNTVLRVRPGDSLVLAGLVTSNNTANSQGLPVGGDSALPLYGDDTRQNHELVMIVKPAIVQFADSGVDKHMKGKETASLPDAIVIDKDGSRPFELPQPVPHASLASVLLPQELPQPQILLNATDSAPVDKNLMQKGFSHAYDQLLQPSGYSEDEGRINE